MKTSTLRKAKAPFLLAFACAALTGCFSDSGTNSDGGGNAASIRGQIQGDVETNASGSSDTGWSTTVVTTHSIMADGSLGATEDSVMANANGTFVINTAARGHKNYIVRARRGSSEWMAHFEGTLEDGQAEDSRPLNLESSLESSVLLELNKTSEGREVQSSEVSLAIDAKASASASGEYRGTETQRNLLVARLAASVNAASRARQAFLTVADSQYTAHRTAIDSARVRAEAQFNASLYAAARDTAASHAAERAYLNATVKAYVDANVERTTYARSAEASYHAFVRLSATLSDSARTATARSYARVLVIASDTAMRQDFRNAGSSSARLTLVADAGAHFRSSVDTAGSLASIDSASAHFRAEVRSAFNNTADTSFTLFGTAATQLALSLDSLSSTLITQINASLTGDAVGQAYGNAHAYAYAQALARIRLSGSSDDDKAKAAASVVAFLSVQSAGHN